jgi:RNA polymerase sigma-70 factor (ECF subfamily)
LRHRKRHAELAADPVDLDELGTHEDAERREARLLLATALATLSPRERELVALKFFAGLSNAEIGEVVGISESNAGTRLHRIIEKLREACDGAL